VVGLYHKKAQNMMDQITELTYKLKKAKELINMYYSEIRSNRSIDRGFCRGTLFKDRLKIVLDNDDFKNWNYDNDY
jgi:hypothetical protein